MENKKFAISFSGGKDSVLALYRMIKRGNTPVALITTVNKDRGDTWTHSINDLLMDKMSQSLQIPILKCICGVDDYELKFENTLKQAKKMGAVCCAFGDIDIQAHREWDETRCINSYIKSVFPLWQEDREKLVREFIDYGFKAMIKVVNLNYLDEIFLGQTLDKKVLKEIKDTGSDCCGENGEYHTIVYNGPIFKNEIEIKIEGRSINESHGNLIFKT